MKGFKPNKRPVGRPYKIGRKERNLFFLSLTAGIGMGVVGSFLVNSFYDLVEYYGSTPLWSKWGLFILSLVLFFGVFYWFNKEIIKNAYS